jgi:hypothetical protein
MRGCSNRTSTVLWIRTGTTTSLSSNTTNDAKVGATAADSIGKIGIALRRVGVTPRAEIGRALISHYRPGESPWLVSAVGAVGYLDGVDFLEQVLTAEDPEARAAAAWALDELGVNRSLR